MFFSIPSGFGSYALHLNAAKPQKLQVGRLGEYPFPAGDYLYFGSAMGPGGLRARLSRHLRGDGRKHWHIDWLRAVTVVRGYFCLETNSRCECLWSQALINHPGAGVPVPGFGASDCSNEKPCAAHLICFESGVDPEGIRVLLSASSGGEVVYCAFTSNSQPEFGYME